MNLDELRGDRPDLDYEPQQAGGIPRNLQLDETAVSGDHRPRATGLLHIVSGSQRHNMEMMARAGRGGGRPRVLRGRAGLLALRDAV